MKAVKSDRGFVFVVHEPHPNEPSAPTRLISESSAIGDYEDSMDKPGSSYLWIGDNHHLDREEVAELVGRMQHWIDTGRLAE